MPKSVRVDGVYDIECEHWDRFVIGGLLLASGEYWSTTDEEAFAARLLAVRGDIWAHNGGHYDVLWLLRWLRRWRVPCRVALAGSRVTCVDLGRVRYRDSYALVPLSLAKAAPLGGLAKQELALPCTCGKACGGYCAIRRRMPVARRRLVVDYLEQDCRVLLASLRAVAQWCAERDVPMRGTIGGTAWAHIRSTGIAPAKWTRGEYMYARRAYYGGRVEVYRMRSASGWRYDRNSSYPAALVETALPVGPRRLLGAAEAGAALAAGRPGIYQAVIHVPDMRIPPLPYRAGERTLYPVGQVRGVWTAVHLQRACEVGSRIVRVESGLVWAGTDYVMRPWCEWVWTERAAHAEGTAWRAWIKWLANSATGKFGQAPDHPDVRLGVPPRPAAWTAIDPCGGIWTRAVWRLAPCAYVHWAAYLTSAAEVAYDRQVTAAGEGAVYGDTDSCFTERELGGVDIGPDLGQWKCEGEYRAFRALAPKLYTYDDPAVGPKVRAKGFSRLDRAGFDALAAGGTHVVDTGVTSFLQSLRSGGELFTHRVLTRRVHPAPTIGGRLLDTGGITTRAPTIAEYTALLSAGRGTSHPSVQRMRRSVQPE